MSLAEYHEWIAENAIQPLGTAGVDILAAVAVSWLLSPHCRKGKSIDPSEVFAWLQEPEEQGNQVAALTAVFRAAGIEVKRV